MANLNFNVYTRHKVPKKISFFLLMEDMAPI